MNKKEIYRVVISVGILLTAIPSNAYARSTIHAETDLSYLYRQNSNWWASEPGSASNGGAIVAFATAASILTKIKVSPTRVAWTSYSRNYWRLNGNPPTSLIKKLSNVYHLSCRERNGKDSLSMSEIIQSLVRGDVVIARNNEHYIVIYAYRSKGEFRISDLGNSGHRGEWIDMHIFNNSLPDNTSFYIITDNSKENIYEA